MGVNYYKRYRMEFDLRQPLPRVETHRDYVFFPWRHEDLDCHAWVKYQSFRDELDSNVFPCLGEPEGCRKLMSEIASRDCFLPEATWLAVYQGEDPDAPHYCGTIQGITRSTRIGSIQNVGTVPEHRGHGIAAGLVVRSLAGFQQAGLQTAYLEVTAINYRAVRLYLRLGFRSTRTLYKAVQAYS